MTEQMSLDTLTSRESGLQTELRRFRLPASNVESMFQEAEREIAIRAELIEIQRARAAIERTKMQRGVCARA